MTPEERRIKREEKKQREHDARVAHDATDLCARYLLAGRDPDFVRVHAASGLTVRAWGLHRCDGGCVAITDSQSVSAQIENADRWARRVARDHFLLDDHAGWWLRDCARELVLALEVAQTSDKRGF